MHTADHHAWCSLGVCRQTSDDEKSKTDVLCRLDRPFALGCLQFWLWLVRRSLASKSSVEALWKLNASNMQKAALWWNIPFPRSWLPFGAPHWQLSTSLLLGHVQVQHLLPCIRQQGSCHLTSTSAVDLLQLYKGSIGPSCIHICLAALPCISPTTYASSSV